MTKLPGNNDLHSIFNHLSLPPSLVFFLIPALPEVSPFTLLWFHPYCQWIAEWEAFSVSPSGFSELENSPAHSSGNRMVVDKAESWDDIHGAWRDREHQGHLPRIARGSVAKIKRTPPHKPLQYPNLATFTSICFSPILLFSFNCILMSFILHLLRGNLELQPVPSLILHLHQTKSQSQVRVHVSCHCWSREWLSLTVLSKVKMTICQTK